MTFRHNTYTLLLMAVLMLTGIGTVRAQVGQYRNDLAVGFTGGYQLNTIGFVPNVQQNFMGGKTFGFTARYTCEKYFNTICAVQLEVNYAEQGWKEKILSENDEPCINNVSGEAERYVRTIRYVQIPLLAHLGWGREVKGGQFFFKAGPQFGLKMSESTDTNFDFDQAMNTTPNRVSPVVAQDTMAVQNSFDYGIAAGIGMEVSMGRAGHLQLEARYYYGLGNIYKDSKRDYFARSNHNSIIFKAAYLFDIVRTKGAKRK